MGSMRERLQAREPTDSAFFIAESPELAVRATLFMSTRPLVVTVRDAREGCEAVEGFMSSILKVAAWIIDCPDDPVLGQMLFTAGLHARCTYWFQDDEARLSLTDILLQMRIPFMAVNEGSGVVLPVYRQPVLLHRTSGVTLEGVVPDGPDADASRLGNVMEGFDDAMDEALSALSATKASMRWTRAMHSVLSA
jgi:hypothetical protein